GAHWHRPGVPVLQRPSPGRGLGGEAAHLSVRVASAVSRSRRADLLIGDVVVHDLRLGACAIPPPVPSPVTAALPRDVAVTARISPRGIPLLAPAPDADRDGLGTAVRQRIVDAFDRGAGHGLLILGAAAPGTELTAPLGFLRDVGTLYVTRLCAAPDLETARGALRLAPPADELARLASAVPP